jgi:hypothetical protein
MEGESIPRRRPSMQFGSVRGGKPMRRLLLTGVSLLLLLSLTATAVFAQNPHFVGRITFTNLGTQLQATGSVAGLGNTNIDVILDAQGIATIECTNPGGNVAPGQTKAVAATGSQTSIEVKNGRANFNVTTDPPPAPDPAEVCPNPQWSAAIVSVTFTSATITVIQPSGSGNVVLQRTFTFSPPLGPGQTQSFR